MTYVMVCIAGDNATRAAGEIGRSFVEKTPTPHHLHPFPSHEDVRGAISSISGVVPAIVTAHHKDGQLFRHFSGPDGAWADAAAFAETFRGVRVYVYACSTIEKSGSSPLAGFGPEVVEKGVQSFIGHRYPVHGETGDGDVSKVVHALWAAFLEGEDDIDRLKLKGRQAWPLRRRGPKETLARMEALSRVINGLIYSLDKVPAAGEPPAGPAGR